MFTEVNGKPVCLVCQQQVSVLKEYNIRRHYETQHGEKYNRLHGENTNTNTIITTHYFYCSWCKTVTAVTVKIMPVQLKLTQTNVLTRHSYGVAEEHFLNRSLVGAV